MNYTCFIINVLIDRSYIMKSKLLFVLLILSITNVSFADDLNTMFGRVNGYVAANNYPKALEELTWVRKEIEKQHIAKLGKLLPDSIIGFTGEKVEASGALGFNSIQRTYKKGDVEITLSITDAPSMAGDQMGGLAGLGRMAAMMGSNTPGNETVRIDGRTATIESTEDGGAITIYLNSGSILKLEGSSITADTLKQAAEALNVGRVDGYLSGQSN